MRVCTRCLICHKPTYLCHCVDVCHRCGLPARKCMCEESIRPPRYAPDTDRFEEDEERADDFRRDYMPEPGARSDAYRHGFNTVKKFGVRQQITWCKYIGLERTDFFRGVSDARSMLL